MCGSREKSSAGLFRGGVREFICGKLRMAESGEGARNKQALGQEKLSTFIPGRFQTFLFGAVN